MSDKKKCPDCESEMDPSGGPRELVSWTIPFTQIELKLWDWKRQEMVCTTCAMEKAQDTGRSAYDAGMEDGYNRGFDDARRMA